MEFKLLFSPPALPLIFEPACPEIGAGERSEPIRNNDSEETWEFVTPPQSAIELDASQLPQEQSKPEVSIRGNHGDGTSDVAAHSSHLLEPYDYQSTQPTESEKAIYGIKNAKRKARGRWLQSAADLICSRQQPEVEQAYRNFAQSNGLYMELAREILIHRIEKSPAQVQRSLAQHLVLSVLILEESHGSNNAQAYLESDQDELLECLESSLRIPVPPIRTKRDEAQITSLIYALLGLSGGEVDLRQHIFAEEYTAKENADLYASVFGITMTKQFGDFDSEQMCNSISKSSMFSGMVVNIRNLGSWITRIRDFLRLGFPEGYLNLPSQVLSGFGFGQVDVFNCYLAHTYQVFPSLQKPENSMLMLLAYSSTLITQNTVDSSRQLDVLREWANSEDGWSIRKKLARDAQDSHSVEQLALMTVALMSYSRLLPDHKDHLEQPVKSSYLADLDAHFHGDSLGNSGRVAEEMVFALLRVLSTFGDQYEDLIAFLVTVLDREPPLLHVLAGLSDQYVRWRIDRQTHGAAFDIVMGEILHLRTETPLQQFRHLQTSVTYTVEELHAARTMEDVVPSSIATAFSSGEKSRLTPSGLQGDQYRLTRLSGVEHKDVSEFFQAQTRAYGVPSVLPLGDGSYEIVVRNSHCTTLKDGLGKKLPGSNFDLNYDPVEPTDIDLKFWGYDTAKKLNRYWFILRATRIAGKDGSVAAAYYIYSLKHLYGLDAAVIGSCFKSYDVPLVPTFRGYLESEDEAVCLVEACLRRVVAHSSQGPRDREATISGNVFVWEASSAGIDRWSDGMEWITRERGDFEVCESVDAPGFMKKTISISACRTFHHVVSYYTAQDVQSLARPSWCMIFMP